MHPLRISVACAAVSSIAVLFGIVTIIAGTRVLLGSNPGYVVYPPLLYFNTIMGVVYIAVGVIAWRRPRLALCGSAAISLLNIVALGSITYLYTRSGQIAGMSMRAMAFRTAVWLALLLVLAMAGKGGTRNT